MLAKLINLGGFLNGSKTWLGVITTGVVAIHIFLPNVAPFVMEVLAYFGITLLPIGLLDKAMKANAQK